MTPHNATSQMNGIYTASQGGASISGLSRPPVMGAKRFSINATATIDGTSGTYFSFSKTQKAFCITGFRVIAQDTATTAYVLVNKDSAGNRTSIASITQTTPTAGDVTVETVFDVTGTIFNPADTLELYIFRSGVTSVPVSIMVSVVPVGNT